MTDRPLRVMWLLNHTTLRQFEIPQMESLGITEIFLPKSFPYDEGNLSASIDHSKDAALNLEAFFFEDAGEIFAGFELLKPELAEAEDAIHHYLRLLLHGVDLADEVGLDGCLFFGGDGGLREGRRRQGEKHEEFSH